MCNFWQTNFQTIAKRFDFSSLTVVLQILSIVANFISKMLPIIFTKGRLNTFVANLGSSLFVFDIINDFGDEVLLWYFHVFHFLIKFGFVAQQIFKTIAKRYCFSTLIFVFAFFGKFGQNVLRIALIIFHKSLFLIQNTFVSNLSSRLLFEHYKWLVAQKKVLIELFMC